MFLVLVIVSFIIPAAAQRTVTLDKRLNDGGGELAKVVVGYFADNAPESVRRREAAKPFAIGFFGWKTLVLTQLGVGKIEGLHININRTVLHFYDPELDATLDAISARGVSPTDWIDVPDAEQKAVQKYVVQKWGGKYTGITAAINADLSYKADPAAKWKYNIGSSLGELGGTLTNWYKLPNNAAYNKKVSQLLTAISNGLDSKPADVPDAFVQDLARLKALGARTSFNEAQRDEIAATLKAALMSFVGGSATASKPAVTTPAPVVRPAATSSQYTDRGIILATAGKHREAVAEYDKAIAADPKNGAAFYRRAKSLEEIGSIDAAIADYDKMIALKYDLQRAYYNRGTLRIDSASQLAIDDLTKAIALDARYKNAYFNRASAYYHLNKFQAAIDDLTKLLTFDPQDVDTLKFRAQTYCQMKLPLSAIRDQKAANLLGAKLPLGCEK